MAVLVLLCLAYWWLDNRPHELFGTAMFVLLGWHVFTNRSWFRNLTRGRYGPRRILVVALHLALIVNVLILLVTSLMVSKSVFSFLGLPNSALLSEIHWFSAYWVIISVGVHVGLHWARLIGILKSALGVPSPRPAVRWSLRVLAAAAALFGVASLPVLDVGTKLSFGYSVDFWDFEASVLPFFVRWSGVIALAAVAARLGDAALARIRIART
ncbi:DUF4405 domain-containing protein [Sinorhizobium medicae]|nr:DUF4405 domain-containing protein [Sinorhizobium medicae]